MPDGVPTGVGQKPPQRLRTLWAIAKLFLLPMGAFILLGAGAVHWGWADAAPLIPLPLLNGVLEVLEGGGRP